MKGESSPVEAAVEKHVYQEISSTDLEVRMYEYHAHDWLVYVPCMAKLLRLEYKMAIYGNTLWLRIICNDCLL